MIHNIPAAIQRAGELALRLMQGADARRAPVRKYGRRQPSRSHVLSLICPIIGCRISPVTGAAIQKIGIFVNLCAQGLKDPADIRILKRANQTIFREIRNSCSRSAKKVKRGFDLFIYSRYRLKFKKRIQVPIQKIEKTVR